MIALIVRVQNQLRISSSWLTAMHTAYSRIVCFSTFLLFIVDLCVLTAGNRRRSVVELLYHSPSMVVIMMDYIDVGSLSQSQK